jgi:hypothetical protein
LQDIVRIGHLKYETVLSTVIITSFALKKIPEAVASAGYVSPVNGLLLREGISSLEQS